MRVYFKMTPSFNLTRNSIFIYLEIFFVFTYNNILSGLDFSMWLSIRLRAPIKCRFVVSSSIVVILLQCKKSSISFPLFLLNDLIAFVFYLLLHKKLHTSILQWPIIFYFRCRRHRHHKIYNTFILHTIFIHSSFQTCITTENYIKFFFFVYHKNINS